MKLIKLNETTFQVDFESQRELMKTFLRFQEYYESPEFRHKVFTLKEYVKWYKKYTERTIFTYYNDWNGCNVPGYVFDFFREGHMNPLSKRERKLLDLLEGCPKDFYVIGTVKGGESRVLEHEICHSLFYTNPEYKRRILGELSKHDIEYLIEAMLDLGYSEEVALDEAHAYACANPEWLEKCTKTEINKDLISKLQEIKKSHM